MEKFSHLEPEVRWSRVLSLCLFVGAAVMAVIAFTGCTYQSRITNDAITRQWAITPLSNKNSQAGTEHSLITTDGTYVQQGLNQFWDSPTTQMGIQSALSAYGMQQAGRVAELEAENARLRAEIEELKKKLEIPADPVSWGLTNPPIEIIPNTPLVMHEDGTWASTLFEVAP